MMPYRVLTLGVLAWSLMILTGCGWQLRGTGGYQGPTTLLLTPDDRYAPLTLAVLDNMQRMGVTASAEAPIQLVLNNEELNKRVVAVTSIGSPSQYEMSLAATFRYQMTSVDTGQASLSPPHTLSVVRVFDFDPSNTVAKSEEENTLLEEMRQELARRILIQARYTQFTPSYGQTQP